MYISKHSKRVWVCRALSRLFCFRISLYKKTMQKKKVFSWYRQCKSNNFLIQLLGSVLMLELSIDETGFNTCTIQTPGSSKRIYCKNSCNSNSKEICGRICIKGYWVVEFRVVKIPFLWEHYDEEGPITKKLNCMGEWNSYWSSIVEEILYNYNSINGTHRQWDLSN